MMTTLRAILSALLIATLTGCATAMAPRVGSLMPSASAKAGEEAPDRKLIWSGSMTLEANPVSNAVQKVAELTKAAGGYMQSQSQSDDESFNLSLRIPAPRLRETIDQIRKLGHVTYEQLSSEDVTEQLIDSEARVNNLRALRDRLKELLAKTNDVKEILAVETELNRVQSELDSLEGRLNALKGQVDYSTLQVTIQQRPILGPLGYAFKGIWWAFGKLFVIRG